MSHLADILTVSSLLLCVACYSGQLTWRDMQHLVVRTAKPNNLQTDDWRMNAARFNGTAQL